MAYIVDSNINIPIKPPFLFLPLVKLENFSIDNPDIRAIHRTRAKPRPNCISFDKNLIFGYD